VYLEKRVALIFEPSSPRFFVAPLLNDSNAPPPWSFPLEVVRIPMYPVSRSGPSGHLRIVAAQAWFLMSGQAPFVNVFGEPGRAPHGMAVEFEAICIVDQAIEDARPQVKFF